MMAETLEYHDPTWDVRIITSEIECRIMPHLRAVYETRLVLQGVPGVAAHRSYESGEHGEAVGKYLEIKVRADRFKAEWQVLLPLKNFGPEVLEWLEDHKADFDVFSHPYVGRFIGLDDADTAFHFKMRWL